MYSEPFLVHPVTVVVAHVAAQRVDAVMLIGFILVLAIIAGS
jgi:hypothetical protein